MNNVDEIIKQYRDAIDGKVEFVTNRLVRSWQNVIDELDADISALSAEIERRMLSGEIVTQQMLWDMESYRRTQKEMLKLVDGYTKGAEAVIREGGENAFLLGVDKADALLRAEYRSVGALTPFWERLNVDAYNAAFGATSVFSPLYDLMKDTYGDTTGAFQASLLNSIARGYGAVRMANEVKDALGLGLDRSLLIAQTEMARAYRTGTVNQYRKSGVVEYYVRLVKKETACVACLVLDGEKYELEEDMQDHPRGYCDVIAKVKGVPLPEWEKGKDWFEKQSEDYQKKVLGKGKYELWKSGQVKLDDFAKKVHSDKWGDAPAVVSLKDVVDKHGLRKPMNVTGEGGFVNLNGKQVRISDLAPSDIGKIKPEDLAKLTEDEFKQVFNISMAGKPSVVEKVVDAMNEVHYTEMKDYALFEKYASRWTQGIDYDARATAFEIAKNDNELREAMLKELFPKGIPDEIILYRVGGISEEGITSFWISKQAAKSYQSRMGVESITEYVVSSKNVVASGSGAGEVWADVEKIKRRLTSK